MQVLIDFISLIGELLLSIVDFVVTLITDIVFIVQLAGQAIAAIPGYFSWLPAPILALVGTGIAVIFIYKIAGR